jgi:hypothetical protein
MDIDERIEKLAERDEAVRRSVELLALENRKLDVLIRETEGSVGEMLACIRDLFTVVRSHE